MNDPDLAERLAGVLRTTHGVTAAYLFGSVVTGRRHRQSDVDIAVRLDRKAYPTAAASLDARLELIAALQPLAGGDVDLVVLNDAPPQLAREIMTVGRRLFAADAEEEHALLRLTLSRAADLVPFLRRARATKLKVIAP